MGNVNIWGRTNAYPGQARYHYSNAGFTLLALVVECAAGGASLQSLAKRFIFDPLEMRHTSYTLAELRASGDVHVAVPSYSTRESVGLYGVAEWCAFLPLLLPYITLSQRITLNLPSLMHFIAEASFLSLHSTPLAFTVYQLVPALLSR